MASNLPNEPVYYYECSNGSFRLTYFIPPGELQRLCDEGRLSSRAYEDFPDGVDLGCKEADFLVFEEAYGYRPGLDPAALCDAFFAMFSATRNWKKFRGSGFIPATDLERHLEDVDRALLEKKLGREKAELPSEPLPPRQYRRAKHRQAIQQTRAVNVLKKLRLKGIDPSQSLRRQEFSPIRMAEGEAAEEVFQRLHQKQRKEDKNDDRRP